MESSDARCVWLSARAPHVYNRRLMSEPHRSVRMGAIARDVIEAVLLACVLFLVLRLVVQNTIVDGPSMEPTFADAQWLLVNKLAYRFGAPARGDVIVFRAPDGSGREFIKRIIALPGETVALRAGTVSVDGQPLREPWAPRLDASAFGPYTVPDGAVFVLGDNRPFSNDSRSWDSDGSALAETEIVGRAWVSVWPPARWGRVYSDRPGPGRSATAAAP
jgi:signal peptidase I